MVDLSSTIIAKSDQLNADDLMGGPITVEIEGVKEGTPDQPIAVLYKGCNGKPYYPCKSMRRVLVNVWGKDGSSYAGKSMTLFRDPSVKFGGIVVGGIRISHMSHITQDMPLALQVTRGSKKLYTVKPLRIAEKKATHQTQGPSPKKGLSEWFSDLEAALSNAQSEDEVQTILQRDDVSRALASPAMKPEHKERLNALAKTHLDRVSQSDDAPWAMDDAP